MSYSQSIKMFCHNVNCKHEQLVTYFNGNKPGSSVCKKCGFKTLKDWPLFTRNDLHNFDWRKL